MGYSSTEGCGSGWCPRWPDACGASSQTFRSVPIRCRCRATRRMTMSLAPLTVEPLPDELLKAWMSPLRDRRIRRDLVKVLRGIDPRYTLQAAEALRGFERP